MSVLSASAWALMCGLVAARLVEGTLLLAGLKFSARAHGGPEYDRRWLASSWPLSAYWLLQVGYLRAQVIAPALILSSAGAGELAQGFNLYSAGTLLPGALALATWPQVARAADSSPADVLRELRRFIALALAMVAPASAIIAIFPGFVLETVFGHTSASLEAYARWGRWRCCSWGRTPSCSAP